jgi:hypothetical protein
MSDLVMIEDATHAFLVEKTAIFVASRHARTPAVALRETRAHAEKQESPAGAELSGGR